MYRNYKTKTGKIIHTWYRDWGSVTVIDGKTGKDIAVCDFDCTSINPTFEYNGEQFEVDNYIYDNIDTMIKRVEQAVKSKNTWAVKENELLGTFLKESDKIGVIMNVESFDTLIPELGIGLKSNGKTIKVLMNPVERNYTKEDWHHKIEFCATNKNIRPFVGCETYYFDDFYSMLLEGMFELVNLDKISID